MLLLNNGLLEATPLLAVIFSVIVILGSLYYVLTTMFK